VTGGAGFFGGVLVRQLLEAGERVVSFDVARHEDLPQHPELMRVEDDLRDRAAVDRVFKEHGFRAVFHCAAALAHAVKDEREVWTSNVDGTRNLAEAAIAAGVKRFVFISTNCLWARGFGRPVTEADAPEPIEVYGRSKAEGERLLLALGEKLPVAVLRTPTIIDSGRLGLLSILFDFILEGRRVWVVGKGANRYQFVYAPDLADACLRAERAGASGVFNVGSTDVRSLRDVFQRVIDGAKTGARVASLPRRLTLLGMRLAHALGVSPLGPYHYRMIAEDFEFDTAKIRRELGWAPTLTNGEMLLKAFEYYRDHKTEIDARQGASAHRSAAKMGVIRLLKWMS
jgi:nucleoside-diphosphate-sugar epimerase